MGCLPLLPVILRIFRSNFGNISLFAKNYSTVFPQHFPKVFLLLTWLLKKDEKQFVLAFSLRSCLGIVSHFVCIPPCHEKLKLLHILHKTSCYCSGGWKILGVLLVHFGVSSSSGGKYHENICYCF